MVKSHSFYTSLRVTNLAKAVLPKQIVRDKRFWSTMVKIEIENMNVDLSEYFEGL